MDVIGCVHNLYSVSAFVWINTNSVCIQLCITNQPNTSRMSNRASLFAIEVSSDQHFYHKLNQIQTVYILLTMANILWMFKQNKKLCKQLFKYLSMHSRYMKPKQYIITFIENK